MARHLLARTLHDLGLATWFGGSLMGAVGLNGATASLRNPDERSAAATVGWTRWAPVSTVAVGAHLVGAVQLLRTERRRVALQTGVGRSSAVKTGLTAAAVGATAYSGVLNRRMAAAGHVPAQGATEPAASTPPDVARTQKQLRAVQWLIPGLTGGLVAATAWQSEQMRPGQVLAGTLSGSLSRAAGPVVSARVPLAGAAAGLGLLGAARSRRTRHTSSVGGAGDAAVYPATGAASSTAPTAPAYLGATPPGPGSPGPAAGH